MNLAFWVNLLAFKHLLGDKHPSKQFYKHWQERLVAVFAMKKNIALTQAHLVQQRKAMKQFEQAHNLVAFEHPTQEVTGAVFNQLR